MSYDVNSLESHWMPFTANRDFKQNPRIVVKSDGMYLWDYKGGEVIDGSSGCFVRHLDMAAAKLPRRSSANADK